MQHSRRPPLSIAPVRGEQRVSRRVRRGRARAQARRRLAREPLAELDAEERLAFACEKAPTDDPVVQKIRAAFLKIEADFKKVTDDEKVEVQELGGLHVVGTERHESRRIDNQVRLNCRCTNAVVLLFFSFAQCTCYPMMND